MKTKYFVTPLILLSLFLSSCQDDENKDIEKNVQITIYAETGYGTNVLSDIWMEPLLFSENNDKQIQMLLHTITEGLDFDYERGYEYTFNAKKVWMHEPPQDVSSIKYIFMELVSKKKVITENKEEKIELYVSPKMVKFLPKYPMDDDEEDIPKIYDALLVKQNGTDNWVALPKIEDFAFETGYEYVLEVKKITLANPYSVNYILVDILSKEEKE